MHSADLVIALDRAGQVQRNKNAGVTRPQTAHAEPGGRTSLRRSPPPSSAGSRPAIPETGDTELLIDDAPWTWVDLR